METKKCTKCGKEWEFSEFSESNRYRDGHVSQCKQCRREQTARWMQNNNLKFAGTVTKICSQCHREKDIVEFYSGFQCKECKREYAAKNQKIRRQKIVEFRNSLKGVPCLRCGTQYSPYIMQFHHKDPPQKHKNLSAIKTIKQMIREAKKCIIVCATCHEIIELESKISARPIDIRIRRPYMSPRRQKLTDIANGFRDSPCLDCGKKFPYSVMHFHHRNRSDKRFEIMSSLGLKIVTKELLLEEINKCDVLCPNCHLEREWGVNGILRNHFKKKYSTE